MEPGATQTSAADTTADERAKASAEIPATSAAATAAKLTIIVALPIVCLFVALICGRYPMTLGEVIQALIGAITGQQLVSDEVATLVLTVRLPRALGAALVGAALSASGAAYQGVFRNPLVNPGLLGVSSGAGFGAALAIVVAGGGALIYPSAFTFGIVAVALSCWIARVYRQTPVIMLILGGTIVSAVFSALISLMKYVADAETQLPSIVYWLMGSLASVGWDQLWSAIPIAVGVALLLLFSWRIDVMSMGDKEARALGVNVETSKAAVVCGATLATAGAVCMAGSVGWVGLVIPHVGRMIVGPRNTRLMWVSCCLGAAFLLVVDTIARCVVASELPLGILTALIGAPFFVYLLKRTKGGVWK